METVSEDRKPVICGDFLDNIIPYMDKALFYKYYSDLTSMTRVMDYTLICIIDSSLHPEVNINVVKRFTDVLIEHREREEKGGRFIREVRVNNKVDKLRTNWEKY